MMQITVIIVIVVRYIDFFVLHLLLKSITMFIAEQILNQRVDDCSYRPDDPCNMPVKCKKAPAEIDACDC